MAAALKKAIALQDTTASQVMDVQTLTKLDDAITDAQNMKTVGGCEALQPDSVLRQHARSMSKQLSGIKENTKALTSATMAVTDSKAAKNEAERHRLGTYESAECHRCRTGTAGWQLVQGVRQRPRAWHLENAISTARALIDGNGTDRQGHAKRRRITRRRIISLRAPANSRNRTRPLTHQKRVLPSRVNKFFHSSV
ncbi:hypothetical protein [Bifidobacterium dentium]|uniref:hypothetical protein n=1 Tax=Bifidobacterium dentium TaxID=1689 RepID=UPI0018B0B3CB|nr:hypothetical protein [Bifidobacterium dentium]MBF9694826.1 hypothetical protein [Bifidobacterium dentium]